MQKLNYIHHKPVSAGFVIAAEHWIYSSADNYAGGKGMMDVLLLFLYMSRHTKGFVRQQG